MNPQVAITVVFPVYNAARYVEEALSSILSQTCKDFEIILINDGSTDDSLRIMQKAAQNDPRCRIINRENRGIVFSCNEGLQLARGEYIFRMDSDDIARPTRFERQLSYLKAHPDCVAVGSKAMMIDPDGFPLMEQIIAFEHEEIVADYMIGGLPIVHPTVAMPRQALMRIGGYRQEFEWAEDVDLFLRLAEIGRLANLPEVLLDYRQHLASVGYARAIKQGKAARAAIADARRRRGLPPQAEVASPPAVVTRVVADEHRKWAWWALQGGHSRTARKHAFRAFRLDPASRDNVRLLACAIRGY